MKKLSFYVVGVLALVASGCEFDVTGTLTANQALTFNYEASAKKMAERVRKGKELTKILPAGQYAAKIEVESDELELKAANQGIRFNLPKNTLPKNGGRVVIQAAQTGQTYDLLADVAVDISQSDRNRGYESCTEAVPYEDCSCSATGQVTCVNRTAYLSAQMDVEYYNVYTRRDIEIHLLTPGTQSSQGQFNGVRTDTEKVYTYKGRCQASRRDVDNIRRTERWQVRDCRPAGGNPGGGFPGGPGHGPGSGGPRGGGPRGPGGGGPGGHPRGL